MLALNNRLMEYKIYTRKLTQTEQESILLSLFGLRFDDEHLVDENGMSFYSIRDNCQYDLTTIKGIFAYHRDVFEMKGRIENQNKIKAALGLYD